MATVSSPLERRSDNEKIVRFDPELLAAPFGLRCAALFVDYIVLLAMPITWLVLARFLSDTGVPDAIGKTIWTLGVLLFVVDCLVLPILFQGRSLGKMLVGLRVVRMDGTRVHAAALVIRNVVGYAITAATLLLGFFIGAITPSGRTLHDYIAGTIVIRGRRKPV